MRLSVECAFPHLGKRGVPSRKSAVCYLHLTEKRTLGRWLTENRSLGVSPSRKSALCDPQIAQNALFRHVAAPGRCGATPRQAAGRVARMSADLGSESGLTEKRTLPDRWGSECAFPSRRDRRMRLSVRVHAQNALFRRMRLSSPAQTWRRLTEKRILLPPPHGKAHSGPMAHGKPQSGSVTLTEKCTL